MSDLPRGWDIPSGVIAHPTIPSITIPAAPGVSHILTSIAASVYSNAAAGESYEIEAYGIVLGFIASDAVVSPQTIEVGSFTWEGELLIPVNTALVVTFSASMNNYGTIEAQGYDI